MTPRILVDEQKLSRPMTQAPKYPSQWIPLNSVPQPPESRHYVLEPLDEKHAEIDFEAIMSCRTRLRAELQWGDWPPDDFTLERNRSDLRRHHDEFIREEAFAYTVLSPERTRCLGCIYLERCVEVQGAQLAFWVIDDALDLETVLVNEVLQWVHRVWPINRVLLPIRPTNSRGLSIARSCGFSPWEGIRGGPLSDHVCFLSEG